MRTRLHPAALVALTILALLPSLGAAQAVQNVQASRLYATREYLEDLLRQLELSASSPVYTAGTRADARADAERIRQRLDEGDFQTGDRIYLLVENEATLTDTFTVAPGPLLDLPTVGTLPLRGVLRAELREHVRVELARFIREPVVQVRTLIRISVTGEVEQPGFYVVPTEGLVTDVITRAGGPTREARLDGIVVERQGQVIWEAEPLEAAIIEGRTLDQLNLRAGDRITVPRLSQGLAGAESAVRTVGFLLTIPLTIFAITQIF